MYVTEEGRVVLILNVTRAGKGDVDVELLVGSAGVKLEREEGEHGRVCREGIIEL